MVCVDLRRIGTGAVVGTGPQTLHIARQGEKHFVPLVRYARGEAARLSVHGGPDASASVISHNADPIKSECLHAGRGLVFKRRGPMCADGVVNCLPAIPIVSSQRTQ